MSLINETTIEDDYRRIRQELFTLISPDCWDITPHKWCLTTAKTKYGLADSKGVIHINHRFIGTPYQSLMEAVLRHEFAHLCVGLAQGHNKHFKHCEHLFKAKFDGHVILQAQAFGQLINYKYQLVAVLANGQIIKLKKTHRKHRKYTGYQYKFYRALYYHQQAIKKFKYISLD
jgi:hypothetical protein